MIGCGYLIRNNKTDGSHGTYASYASLIEQFNLRERHNDDYS